MSRVIQRRVVARRTDREVSQIHSNGIMIPGGNQDAIRMDLGYFPIRPSCHHSSLDDSAHFRVAKTVTLASLRCALGSCPSRESVPRHPASFSISLGGSARPPPRPTPTGHSSPDIFPDCPLLYSVDDSQLRRFPPLNTDPLQLSVRAVDRQQRHF